MCNPTVPVDFLLNDIPAGHQVLVIEGATADPMGKEVWTV